jgi:photosystem II 13kDa protein
MAKMQFSPGIDESVVPEIRLTRSKDGTNGQAIFYFEKPDALSQSSTEDVTGLYMIDEEGELITRKVNAKFVNGAPEALEAVYVMKSAAEWDRFMRFMERYGEEKGLGLTKQ